MRHLKVFASAFSILISSQAVAQEFPIRSEGFVYLRGLPDYATRDETSFVPAYAADTRSNFIPGVGTDTGSYRAITDFGYNKVYSTSSSPYSAYDPYSGATSLWFDTLTIDCGGCTGFARVAMDVSASLSAYGLGGTAYFAYNFASPAGVYTASSVVSRFPDYYSEQHHHDGYDTSYPLSQGDGSNWYDTVLIPFSSGEGFNVRSEALCRSGGNSTCDASNSSYWGGILEVLDGNGNAVSDWTISSLSGTDYAGSFAPAVPEPTTWLMMIIGLGAIGAAKRRQRRECPGNLILATVA